MAWRIVLDEGVIGFTLRPMRKLFKLWMGFGALWAFLVLAWAANCARGVWDEMPNLPLYLALGPVALLGAVGVIIGWSRQ